MQHVWPGRGRVCVCSLRCRVTLLSLYDTRSSRSAADETHAHVCSSTRIDRSSHTLTTALQFARMSGPPVVPKLCRLGMHPLTALQGAVGCGGYSCASSTSSSSPQHHATSHASTHTTTTQACGCSTAMRMRPRVRACARPATARACRRRSVRVVASCTNQATALITTAATHAQHRRRHSSCDACTRCIRPSLHHWHT